MNREPGPLIFTHHAFDGSGSIVSTAPNRFLDQMRALVEAGFRCIDLEGWTDGGIPSDQKTFALTFDDGDASILKVAEPLADLGLRATIFVVADRVGSDNGWPGQPRWVPRSRLLDWDELAALRRIGFNIGSHTATHPDLTRLDARGLIREIKGARETIEDRLGSPCRLFAYPYGRTDRRCRRLVGSNHAAGFGTRLGRARRWADATEYPRVDSYYLSHSCLLDRILEGQADGWLRARRKLRAIRSAVRWGRVG